MCRFIAYLGKPILLSKLLHEPKNSLIHQSYHSRERSEPLNGDGYGVAWYAQEVYDQPAVLRSIRPAWNDNNLASVAKTVQSDCVVAHVRAATKGEVTDFNCHPFQFGSLLMMHNGTINGFQKIKRALRAGLPDTLYSWIKGSTDSEHFFALLLGEAGVEDHQSALILTARQVVEALPKAISKLKALINAADASKEITINSVVTNGKWIVTLKYADGDNVEANTLYYANGKQFFCDEGICQMQRPDKEDGAVLVVSEKLTDKVEDWHPIAEGGGMIFHSSDDFELFSLSNE